MMIDPCVEIHSGPDALGRYTWTLHWLDDRAPFCSLCGGNVQYEDNLIVCTGYPGATPPRGGCGARVNAMPRGQVFFCALRDYPLCTHPRGHHDRPGGKHARVA